MFLPQGTAHHLLHRSAPDHSMRQLQLAEARFLMFCLPLPSPEKRALTHALLQLIQKFFLLSFAESQLALCGCDCRSNSQKEALSSLFEVQFQEPCRDLKARQSVATIRKLVGLCPIQGIEA